MVLSGYKSYILGFAGIAIGIFAHFYEVGIDKTMAQGLIYGGLATLTIRHGVSKLE